MAKAIERIERDIAALEEALAAIAEEFHDTYDRYLTALGQAMRQQLILASYHLCTQSYPEGFLSLSFAQRQQLQQAIRQLGQNAGQQLHLLLSLPASELLPHLNTESSPLDEVIKRFLSPHQAEDSLVELKEESESKVEPELESAEIEPKSIDLPSPNSISISKPEELAAWLERLEGAIAKTLQKTSRDANRLLQQNGILPKKLPEPVLEAAAKVEASADSMPGPPNLLNLVIETENDEESQSSTVMHLIAVHLRLSEIEFAAPNVASGRQQIRNLSIKLSNLRREYHKKQREKAIAEAESAWRASWFDE